LVQGSRRPRSSIGCSKSTTRSHISLAQSVVPASSHQSFQRLLHTSCHTPVVTVVVMPGSPHMHHRVIPCSRASSCSSFPMAHGQHSSSLCMQFGTQCCTHHHHACSSASSGWHTSCIHVVQHCMASLIRLSSQQYVQQVHRHSSTPRFTQAGKAQPARQVAVGRLPSQLPLQAQPRISHTSRQV